VNPESLRLSPALYNSPTNDEIFALTLKSLLELYDFDLLQ
jgi:hypothetical protein